MASVTDGFCYDVFLSFRGEDTRYGFTGNLLKALNDRGIRTFMDDQELQKGEEITPLLLKAIEESRIAIIVLSKNYASSSFCLQELSKILDCSIKEKRRLVWPVFYKVDPSDVRKLKGTYGKAMDLHEARPNDNMDRLQKWKNALHQVANLSGFHYKKGDGYEHEFIGKIVERVSREIKPVTLPIADYLVGVEPQRQNVTLLLNVGSDDDRVHMVGIHGIVGIGKTTLALAVYNLIARQFEGSCFLEKIKENSLKHGLLYLQKILLSDIVGEKKIELTSVKQGISVIQQRLRQKKVLLILDDVDKQEQLQALVGRPEWFGPGSRVIITTRDKHLLTYHGVESTYGMKELNQEDAFELLIWKAFKTDKVSPSYANVLNRARAITYASRLPLDLEVIGSHLFKKGIEEWESTLDQYERIPNKDIENILKVSSDALLEEEMEASPKQSSQVEYLRLWNCSLSDESLAVGLKWFANVKELDLRGSKLSILPECIGKCLCLWKLVLDNCEKLQDISGIPPCLKTLCALNCISLTSSCKRKLLNQELHETGNTWFRLPRANLPDWLEHRWMAGNSISFWFCNKFPAIALCVVSRWTWGDYDRPVRVIINGTTFFYSDAENKYAWSKVPHIHLFHMKMEKFNDNPDKALLENKWNHAEVDFGFPFQVSGIHVLKEKSGVKDIRFTNPENDANVEIFPPLELPSQEQLDLLYCDNPEIFQKIIEQMEASPKQSSQVEFLSLWNGKLSDESLAVGLKWFANVKELDLRGSKLSVLPECIGKCLCLWKLVLDNCEKLQDISGIPPCLKTLCALNCISLTSSCKRKLLNQELHETGNTWFRLPRANLPDWLEHRWMAGNSISFWFCNKFPAIALCVVSRWTWGDYDRPVRVIINGTTFFYSDAENKYAWSKVPHIHLFHMKMEKFNDNPDKALLENKWNHAEVDFGFPFQVSGIHVLKEKSSVKDIRFTNPENDANVEIFPPLELPSQEQLDLLYCDNPEIFQKIIEQMEASPKQSSQVEFLSLWNGKLSDESLAVGLKWFANVKELDLRGSKLSVLPECIGKCLCLWKLVLDNCEKLQDISGIPPCLKTLCALNCISLTSSCKRKLLNQELHETGNTWFRLPRANLPDWLEHRWMAGNSISFWFCNKFPAIALCVVSRRTWGDYDRPVRVIINGTTFFYNDAENKYAWSKVPHIHLFHMKMEKFNDNPDKALLENKWNHAEVDFGFPFQVSGIHVLKEKSSVKDIRFTNPENDANVEIFPPLELPSQEQLDLLYCDNPEIFQKIIEQMEACPKQSSQVEFLSLWNGKLSDESLAVGLKWFANVKELDLRGSKLSVLPECIGKCLCLWKLVLDNCEKLQDISGIPPCLKTLCALNCISLTSSCKRKLLNQELHETGNTWFRLPRANLPDWLEHRWMAGNSISFWFCNKFPAIALCVVSRWTWGDYDRPVRVIINGNTFFYNDAENKYAWSKVPHIHLFHMKMEKFNDNPDKALLENKWNHAEVDFGFPFQVSGIHVLKEKSSVKDIRFTNPENDANIEFSL